MHTVTILFENQTYTAAFEGTPTVREVLEQNGISAPHPCGGSGRCGKCAIEISGDASAPDEKELAFGRRLSCRARLCGDAVVTLCADTQLSAEGSAQNIRGIGDTESSVGAAVDIGTTTVALSVYDLSTGECLAAETMLNPQSAVAADVIGRIGAACNGRLLQLKDMITSCIRTLAERSGYQNRIDKWCITGNTTMLYLMQGRDPRTLSAAPFRADHLFGEESTFLGRPLYLPECMHAFVGADITCAVLESGMCGKEEVSLLCDIGTNGEIALWKNGKLYAASTAAGPVFEGAGISCGCQSVRGAVESVSLKANALEVRTIGNAPAVGLCGSGVIDAVACLLDNGTIDETGAMEGNETVICGNVVLKRQDVRAVQLAKAAIAAGIRTLLERTDTKEEEIATFYLAGGFGSHINLCSAVRIGLFPAALKDKAVILGNAALKGAASMLASEEIREKSRAIVSGAECINLGGMPEFNENYIDEMAFPEQTVSHFMMRLAEEVGFSHFGFFPTDVLSFRKEVRDMCQSGRCKAYGMRWTCPPYCGTLEESAEKAKRFRTGILLQVTGQMEDDFDVECMGETGETIKNKLASFIKCVRERHIPCLPMTAGTCAKCDPCTCPDEPCRFPEEAFPSMEAYGLMVNDVCKAADVPYNYGPRTITFTTCVLFND